MYRSHWVCAVINSGCSGSVSLRDRCVCAQGAILEDARVKQRCSRCDFELKRDDKLILDETGGMRQSQPHTALHSPREAAVRWDLGLQLAEQSDR